MNERYLTITHKRTGRVHLVDDRDTGFDRTLCGHWARRDRYRRGQESMIDATCEKCWAEVGRRLPPRRRAVEEEVPA